LAFRSKSTHPFAITVFATILVVSCPCALGIATPMVISLGIDNAARHGILIKGGHYLEKLSSIDTIVFDKTGTLTKGKPEVTDIIPTNEYTDNRYKIVCNEYEVLQLAASAESRSEHPIAQAIVRKAAERSIPLLEIAEFTSFTGQGVIASYSDKTIFVGNVTKVESKSNTKDDVRRRTLTARNSAISESLQMKITNLELEGKSVVGVFVEDNLVGLVAVADTLRENAMQVVDEIQHNVKKEIVLMSGDNERTAKAISNRLGITKILAQVSPKTKALEIEKLQSQGKKVAMIGDGINDAPALAQADIGIAIGSGTDIALSSGDIILIKSDLEHVLYALRLGKYSLRKIKENLVMSFAYNIITISIAAGLLYSFTNSLILTPALAALGWVISDSAVFVNSLFIRRFHFRVNRF
jgi:P-type Cu+ transporter